METTDPSGGRPRGPRAAVLDACVLVPASLRGVLLSAAEQNAFRPVWSEPILTELQGVLRGKHMVNEEQWRHLDTAMRETFRDAPVPEQAIASIAPQMTNDPKDRHVLAAAVSAGAPVIVTNNLKDFRARDLTRVGVQAVHPDAFLSDLLDRAPKVMSRALSTHVADMRPHGRWTEGQLLGHLKGLGHSQPMAPRFAERAEVVLGIAAVPPPARGSRSRAREPHRTRSSPTLEH